MNRRSSSLNAPLARFSEALRSSDQDTLRAQAADLFAQGIRYVDIARVVWQHVSEKSVADFSWLPAASCVNHADSYWLVDLQNDGDKHRMMTFGEMAPEFRRVEPPPPLAGTLVELRFRLRECAASRDWLLTERCLLGIAQQSNAETTLRCIADQLVQPQYLGARSGSWWTEIRLVTARCMIESWLRLSDEAILPVACRVGARLCARGVEPREDLQAAMDMLTHEYKKLSARRKLDEATFVESEFRRQLSSADLETVFRAITRAWRAGASIEQIDVAMTMHCIDRLVRAGHGKGANWDNLKQDLMAAANLRKLAVLDETLAIKSAYHVAWLVHRSDSTGLADEIPVIASKPAANANKQIDAIIDAVHQGDPTTAIDHTNSYTAGGHDGRELLRRLYLDVGFKSTYAGQRCIVEAWRDAAKHPDRSHILAATAGWEADYRRQQNEKEHDNCRSPLAK